MSQRYRGVKRRKRERVIAAYDGRCALCGSKPPNLTVDHMTPRELGGTDADDNLQPMCPRCNRRKANKMGCEFWPDGRRCGQPAVEVLVYVNQLINSHVHEDGTLHACAGCLAQRDEALLAA